MGLDVEFWLSGVDPTGTWISKIEGLGSQLYDRLSSENLVVHSNLCISVVDRRGNRRRLVCMYYKCLAT